MKGETVKCPKCNAEIEEGTVYCPFCAAKVSSDAGRPTAENERMSFDVQENAKGRAGAEDSGNELGKRAIGLIGGFDSNKIVIIGLVAVIVVGGYFVWSRSGSSHLSSESAQSHQSTIYETDADEAEPENSYEEDADDGEGATELTVISNNSGAFPEMMVNVKVTGSSKGMLSKPENWVVKETGVSGGQASISPRSVAVGSDGVCKLAYRSTLGSDSGDSRTVVVSYIDGQSHKVMDSFSYYCDAKSSTVDGYLLSESDSRRYTEAEIREMGMSTWELCLARNEIYARHGRKFKNEKIQEYFDNKDWYEGIYSPEEFDAMTSPLNDIERANAEAIQSYERAIGSEFLNP